MHWYSYPKVEKILDKWISRFPAIDIRGKRLAFFTDLHLNKKDSRINNMEQNIPLLDNHVIPYYRDHVYDNIGIGDIADILEAGSWEAIVENRSNDNIIINLVYKFWYYITGNHDEDIRKYFKRNLELVSFSSMKKKDHFPLGLRLFYGQKFIGFVTHGSLIDIFNKPGWFSRNITRPFVRYIWTWIERKFGKYFERSPAKNLAYGEVLDDMISRYCFERKLKAIVGHTHLACFELWRNGAVFINGGSWTRKGGWVAECIDGKFSLTRWRQDGSHYSEKPGHSYAYVL